MLRDDITDSWIVFCGSQMVRGKRLFLLIFQAYPLADGRVARIPIGARGAAVIGDAIIGGKGPLCFLLRILPTQLRGIGLRADQV